MSTDITAIIVDDELYNLELLEHFVTKYCPQIKILDRVSTKEKGVQLINELQPQLVFLDIVLDTGTGFDLLEEISFRKTHVIFVTSYEEFALKALKFNAVDYILKPVDIEELIVAVNKAHKSILNERYLDERQIHMLSKSICENRLPNEFLTVSSLKKIDFIRSEDVMYLESEGKYTVLYLNNGEQMVSTKSLGYYEEVVDPSLFFRIHKSYLVNLKYVTSINKEAGFYCEIANHKPLPIAKRRLQKLQEFLFIK